MTWWHHLQANKLFSINIHRLCSSSPPNRWIAPACQMLSIHLVLIFDVQGPTLNTIQLYNDTLASTLLTDLQHVHICTLKWMVVYVFLQTHRNLSGPVPAAGAVKLNCTFIFSLGLLWVMAD